MDGTLLVSLALQFLILIPAIRWVVTAWDKHNRHNTWLNAVLAAVLYLVIVIGLAFLLPNMRSTLQRFVFSSICFAGVFKLLYRFDFGSGILAGILTGVAAGIIGLGVAFLAALILSGNVAAIAGGVAIIIIVAAIVFRDIQQKRRFRQLSE